MYFPDKLLVVIINDKLNKILIFRNPHTFKSRPVCTCVLERAAWAPDVPASAPC